MADTIQLTITAKDAAGKVLVSFNKELAVTGKAAAAAGREVEQAGGKWQRFSQYVKSNSAELKTAGRALVRLASDASRAADDTEQALFGIRAAYKDTAQNWVAWSKEMQQATTFSDEAFMRSAQNMKTLVANYDLTEVQVRELISASADLAAVNRIDVYEAVTRVQSAVRGEAEASEYLGLTLNDTYMKNIAFGGSLKAVWEKLSDTEKAQYRYKEILNQSAYAQGKATEATKTAEGQYQQTKNAVQDFVAEIGRGINKSGPWLKMLEDGLGLVDQLAPLYTALTLRRIADTGATAAHTTAQVADNAAMSSGVGVVGKLTSSLAGAGGAGGLAAGLGLVGVALAEVVAAGWIYVNLAQEQNRINNLVGGTTEWYKHKLSDLDLQLQHGVITQEMYQAQVRKLKSQMESTGAEFKTARASVFDLNATLGPAREHLDGVAASAQKAESALRGFAGVTGEVYRGPGDEAARGLQAQKEAYEQLQALPRKRAETEERWNAIITEAAKQSSDTRLQAAISALNTENTRHAAAMAKLKADRETYNAWVVSEQARIAQLRTEGQWQEAGLEEQKLLHIQEWHRQHDATVEDLEREHVARMAGFQAEYQAALQTTADHNLRLQMERKTAALTALKEEEAMLKQVMATGQRTATGWTGSWKKAMTHFKQHGKEEFDKFHDHIKNKLDKPLSLVIHGVYIPPPGMTEGTHGTGRGHIAQEGMVVPGLPHQARPIWAHGGEIIANPARPNAQILGALAAAFPGLGGINLTFSGPIYMDSEARVQQLAGALAREIGRSGRNLARAGIRAGGY